jgi:hypothetical protein
MAVGDLGASKGLRVIPNTKAISLGYDDLNQKADEIAKEINDRAAAVATRAPLSHTHQYTDLRVDSLSVTEWVTAYFTQKSELASAVATLNAGINTKQDALGYTPVRTGSYGDGLHTIFVGWNGTGLLATVDSTALGAFAFHGTDVTFGQIFTPSGRNSPVTSSPVAAYLNSDGRIGAAPSSRRFKKEIKSWSPEKQAVLALRLVSFRYNAATYGNAHAPKEVGVIAEELVELGLDWLTYKNDEGIVSGVHYERIALALLPVIQDHETRLLALEAQESSPA